MLWRARKLLGTLTLILSLKKGEGRVRVERGFRGRIPLKYVLQREKNTGYVLNILRKTGWIFQNLIIWKKKTSAVPCDFRFSKHYQIIVFSTKIEKPAIFNKLRVDLPIPPGYRYERINGVYVADIWDDIRELTSGYFAGDEAIRDERGHRIHTQQSPIALLLRIILASSLPGNTVFDPFAGTGTTLVVAHQLKWNAIGIGIVNGFQTKLFDYNSSLESLVINSVGTNLAYIDNRREAKKRYRFDLWRDLKKQFRTRNEFINWVKSQNISERLLYSKSEQFPDFIFKVKRANKSNF